jgi:hypothetical protein
MITDSKSNRKVVGYYLIDGVVDGAKLAVSVKPNKFRRLVFKLLLGWIYVHVNGN